MEAASGHSKSSESRGKDYAGLITKIGEELCIVEGLDKKEVALRFGRSKRGWWGGGRGLMLEETAWGFNAGEEQNNFGVGI